MVKYLMMMFKSLCKKVIYSSLQAYLKQLLLLSLKQSKTNYLSFALTDVDLVPS